MNPRAVVAAVIAIVLAIFLVALAFKSCGETPAPPEETTEYTEPTFAPLEPVAPQYNNDGSTPVIQYGESTTITTLPNTGGVRLR